MSQPQPNQTESLNSSASLNSYVPKKEEDHTLMPVGTIRSAGDGGEYIILGNEKFFKHELMHAFAGTLNPGLSPLPTHNFGNASALGVFAFSYTTFLLSIVNAEARHTSINAVVIGPAFFYGGLVQFLAGMWEMAMGNTFAACTLGSFGTFWASFGSIFVPGFGIAAAYEDGEELGNAVGFFLLGWGIFTFILLLVTLKSTLPFFLIVFFLFIAFLLLAAAEMTGSVACKKAGGVCGLIVAFIGFYNSFSGVATKANSYLRVPALRLPNSL